MLLRIFYLWPVITPPNRPRSSPWPTRQDLITSFQVFRNSCTYSLNTVKYLNFFIYYNLDNNGLLYENTNAVSQNRKYYIRSLKNIYFKQKPWVCLPISSHSILSWASFSMNYRINASWQGGDYPWPCWGVMEAKIATFIPSALLILVSLFFSLIKPWSFSKGFGSGQFTGYETQQHHGCGQLLIPLAMW